jgi:hypothetical protein
MKPRRYFGTPAPLKTAMQRRSPVLVLSAVVAALCAVPAAAAPVELGVQDDPLLVRLPSAFGGFGADRLLAPERVDAALDALRVDTVRINVPWAQVGGRRPGDPLALDHYDAAVERVRSRGRRVQLTLSGPAPAWATGNRRAGAYAPSARAYAAFTGAVAARFRGRVARYSIWNEPNWWSLLRPRRHAARIYRGLFLRGVAAVRAADPAAKVLIGELAPLGQPEAATPPLRFLRRLTCSDRRWRRVGRCPRLVADGFAHHPYSLQWAPEYPGPGRDDVTTGSLRRLGRALDRLARRGALTTPAGRSLPLYLTELGTTRALRACASRSARPTSAAASRSPRGSRACARSSGTSSPGRRGPRTCTGTRACSARAGRRGRSSARCEAGRGRARSDRCRRWPSRPRCGLCGRSRARGPRTPSGR